MVQAVERLDPLVPCTFCFFFVPLLNRATRPGTQAIHEVIGLCNADAHNCKF